MYLSNTSKKVKDLFNLFEEQNNIVRGEISIYIFEEWNNNLINERNEINPQTTDEDYEIFNPTSIILSENFAHSLASVILENMNKELEKKQLVGIDDFLKINLSDNSKKMEFRDARELIRFFDRSGYTDRLGVKLFYSDNTDSVEKLILFRNDYFVNIDNKKIYLKDIINFELQ